MHVRTKAHKNQILNLMSVRVNVLNVLRHHSVRFGEKVPPHITMRKKLRFQLLHFSGLTSHLAISLRTLIIFNVINIVIVIFLSKY